MPSNTHVDRATDKERQGDDERGGPADHWQPGSELQPATAANLTAQLLQQCLRLFQVGGVEAFGEPTVDLGEHRARPFATPV